MVITPGEEVELRGMEPGKESADLVHRHTFGLSQSGGVHLIAVGHSKKSGTAAGELFAVIKISSADHLPVAQVSRLGVDIRTLTDKPDIGSPDVEPFGLVCVSVRRKLALSGVVFGIIQDLVGSHFGTHTHLFASCRHDLLVERHDHLSVLPPSEFDGGFAVLFAQLEFSGPHLVNLGSGDLRIFGELLFTGIAEASHVAEAVRLPVGGETVKTFDGFFDVGHDHFVVVGRLQIDSGRTGGIDAVIAHGPSLKIPEDGVGRFLIIGDSADTVSVGDGTGFGGDKFDAFLFEKQSILFGDGGGDPAGSGLIDHKVSESLSCSRERTELDICGNRAESGHEDLTRLHSAEGLSHPEREVLSAAQSLAVFRNVHGAAPLFSGFLFTAEHDAGNMPAGEGVAAADNGGDPVGKGDLPELVLLTAFFDTSGTHLAGKEPVGSQNLNLCGQLQIQNKSPVFELTFGQIVPQTHSHDPGITGSQNKDIVQHLHGSHFNGHRQCGCALFDQSDVTDKASAAAVAAERDAQCPGPCGNGEHCGIVGPSGNRSIIEQFIRTGGLPLFNGGIVVNKDTLHEAAGTDLLTAV